MSEFDVCGLCRRNMDDLVLVVEKIGKVYSVEGKDITLEFFVEFNYLRGAVKQYEGREEQNDSIISDKRSDRSGTTPSEHLTVDRDFSRNMEEWAKKNS